MKDALVTIQDGYFDLDMQDDNVTISESLQTLMSTMLFTRPWWANSDAGSAFEDETDGINTNETEKNLDIVINDIKSTLMSEKIVSEFDYKLTVKAEDIFLHCKWRDFESNICYEYKVNC